MMTAYSRHAGGPRPVDTGIPLADTGCLDGGSVPCDVGRCDAERCVAGSRPDRLDPVVGERARLGRLALARDRPPRTALRGRVAVGERTGRLATERSQATPGGIHQNTDLPAGEPDGPGTRRRDSTRLSGQARHRQFRPVGTGGIGGAEHRTCGSTGRGKARVEDRAVGEAPVGRTSRHAAADAVRRGTCGCDVERRVEAALGGEGLDGRDNGATRNGGGRQGLGRRGRGTRRRTRRSARSRRDRGAAPSGPECHPDHRNPDRPHT